MLIFQSSERLMELLFSVSKLKVPVGIPTVVVLKSPCLRQASLLYQS